MYTNNPCPHCLQASIKNGKTKNGKQRYRCKHCKKSFITNYTYRAYEVTDQYLQKILIEGCGIRSIARILTISLSTVLKRIRSIASKITKPPIIQNKEYELDEICTYIKKKTRKYWIVYALRKDTKEIIDFAIGNRTNNTLKRVTDTIILSNANRVFTDKLPNYGWLLPKEIHCTKRNGTNHIERKNLSLRTHLKRLSRRTICFSKSIGMLMACLKIYFWS